MSRLASGSAEIGTAMPGRVSTVQIQQILAGHTVQIQKIQGNLQNKLYSAKYIIISCMHGGPVGLTTEGSEATGRRRGQVTARRGHGTLTLNPQSIFFSSSSQSSLVSGGADKY
jgi:hypothetical protein